MSRKELTITPKKKPAAEAVVEAEQFANNIIKSMRSVDKKGERKRVNFDMPAYLFDLMMEKVDQKGETMRNYFVSLVRKDLGEDIVSPPSVKVS